MADPSTPLGPRSGEVRRLARLVTKRAERQAQGRCVVEGVRALRTALEAGARIETIYAAPGAEAYPDLLEAGPPVRHLAPGVLERVADTVTPQPLLAVAKTPAVTVDGVADLSLVVVLVDVREPGNAGTVVRAAEGAGASAVVFCPGAADAFSPKVVRASAGAVFQLPVVQAGDTGEVLDVLAQRGLRRLGTVATGGEPYDRADWAPPTAVVLGNEAWGVPEALRPHLDGWVTIPMAGHTESLNVAMAASVLLFEAARQRRRP